MGYSNQDHFKGKLVCGAVGRKSMNKFILSSFFTSRVVLLKINGIPLLKQNKTPKTPNEPTKQKMPQTQNHSSLFRTEDILKTVKDRHLSEIKTVFL